SWIFMEAPFVEPMLPAPFRVRKNHRETADTRTLELVTPDGAEPPAWRAGQFMMIYVFGEGEVPISISGDPAQQDRITHTVRAVAPVSRSIVTAKAGAAFGLRGPFGNSWPTELCEGRDVLLVGGGIGLAPLRPAIYTIMANRSRYNNVVALLGARTPDILL